MPSQREEQVVSPEPNPFLFSSQEEYGEYGEKRDRKDASYYGKGEKRDEQQEEENVRVPVGAAPVRGKLNSDLLKEELTVTDSWEKTEHSSPNKKNKDCLFSIVSHSELKNIQDKIHSSLYRPSLVSNCLLYTSPSPRDS